MRYLLGPFVACATLSAGTLYNVTTLSVPGTTYAAGYSMNDAGTVGGSATVAWNVNAGFVGNTSIYGPHPQTTIYRVSNNGNAVGQSYDPLTNAFAPFQWNASTGIVPLAKPPGYSAVEAIGVNDAGTAVGASYTSNGQAVATVWVNGVPTEFGLGSGYIWDINNAGVFTGGNGYTAYTGTAGGGLTPFATPGVGSPSGFAINNVGTVAGVGQLPGGYGMWVKIGSTFTILPLLSGNTYVRSPGPGH